MQAISHIVAATDFSPAAERAIYRAALIAKQLNANLSLIHVAHPLDLYVGTELSFGSQKPVSYTHLDVYKRQILTKVLANAVSESNNPLLSSAI